MFQSVEKIKIHILCLVTFFIKYHAVYEIMWKIIVRRGRPQMTNGTYNIACWIPKATNKHT